MLRYVVMLLSLLCLALPVQAKRLALVIGNDTYKSVSDLKNARADARAVAQERTRGGRRGVLLRRARRTDQRR